MIQAVLIIYLAKKKALFPFQPFPVVPLCKTSFVLPLLHDLQMNLCELLSFLLNLTNLTNVVRWAMDILFGNYRIYISSNSLLVQLLVVTHYWCSSDLFNIFDWNSSYSIYIISINPQNGSYGNGYIWLMHGLGFIRDY